MDELPIRTIFESLSSVHWRTARRTFGSSHATWIGLLADWWVRLSPTNHTVLDGAPSHTTREGVKGSAGQADLAFCRNQEPWGVLEAEGTRPCEKVATIRKYFETSRPELRSIRFGILLLYSYGAKGRGDKRKYVPAEDLDAVEAAKRATLKHSNRPIIYVAVDKARDPFLPGVRSTSEYYSGMVSKVTGIVFEGGAETDRRVFFGEETEGGNGADIWGSVDAIYRRLATSGQVFSDSADLLREDRDR
jgi:hypothetical protein